jgi:hypothetical protein
LAARDQIGRRIDRRQGSFSRLVERKIDLGEREASQSNVELQIDQRLQLNRQDLRIPAGVEGKLVVGQYIGPPLLGAEIRKLDRGDDGNAKFFRRPYPTMSGDNLAVVRKSGPGS